MINKTRKMAILSLCLAIALSCVLAIVPQATKAIAQETDTVTISNLAELKDFRDSVNGGNNNYAGKKIVLNADIDLANEAWTPIGTSANPFNGYFDGQNHTISNLKISGNKDRGSGSETHYAGLFGYMKGRNTAAIKNLTINNADVTGCLYVGVLLGRSYTGGILENCHVTGDVKVDSYAYAGGLVGRHDYSSGLNANREMMAIYNCSVKANAGSTINADYAVSYVGGIVGFLAEGSYVVDACSVENVAVTGVYGVGGISGIAHYGNTISNASVKASTVKSINNDPSEVRTNNVGLIAGAVQGTASEPTTFYGNVAENTTGLVAYTDNTTAAITNLSGSDIYGNTPVVDNPIAKIGETFYYDIVAALDALQAGGTLTLLEDVTYTGKWDCRDNATFNNPVTIDGNGKTLKIVGTINDGYNYLAVLRFTAPATVKNLTMDLSEGVSAFQNKFSAISAIADTVIDNCEFIGSTVYTKARAIIYGENGPNTTTASLNISVTNSKFTNWGYGIVDEMGGKDTAINVTIKNNEFNNSKVNVSATDSIVFNNNKVNADELKLVSYTNGAAFKVEYKSNQLSDGIDFSTNATASNIATDAAVVYAEKVNGELCRKLYATTDAFLAEAVVAGELSLIDDVKLNTTLVLPEDVTIKANGCVINGIISVTRTATFADHVKVTALAFGSGLTINIPVGGCLEITASGRMTIGWNNTFNITGSIADAKTADKATVQPSLIANGASFTGGGVEFNATNAYIKFPASYCSAKGTSGVFNFNIENSIFETAGKLGFDEEQASKATVNFNLKDSVLTTGGHLVFSPKGVSVIDNSNVNVGTSKQLENCGTLIVKNGSVVNGINGSSSNSKMAGTLIVDNATYATTGEFTGSNVGIGTLIAQNGANVTLGSISKTNVYKYDDATIKVGGKDIEDIKADAAALAALAKKQVTITDMSYYKFGLEITGAVNGIVKSGSSIEVTISLEPTAYAVEYIFTYDEKVFSCSDEDDPNHDGKIYVSKFGHQGKDLNTFTLTAISDNINTVIPETVLAVSGNVVATKELALTGVENIVASASKTLKVTLNCEIEVKGEFVNNYSLVLVKGNEGYAYDGVKMIYVEQYGAYAILVKGDITPAEFEAKLTKATGCASINNSGYNVNVDFVADGKVDLKDATAVYACSIVDFSVADYMALYFRADVNGDFEVSMEDVNLITANYTR